MARPGGTDARGLVVAGEVDRTSEQGEIAWRSIRQNTAGFSIGFVAEGRPRKRGKGRLITEVDLLEISWTATPVHPATRVLNWKSADLPAHLIGTAWDPLIATDEQALDQTLLDSKVLAAETLEELGLKSPPPEVELDPWSEPVRPWTALVFDGCTFRELPPGSELATPEQIAAREERQARQVRQVQLIEEAQRDRAQREPKSISIHGLQATKVRVNGEVWFDGERR